MSVGLSLLWASGAAAQSAATPAPAPRFLTRADLSFQWAALISSDPRFSWDAAIGIDFDLVDYGVGRLNFAADYEAVLGSERRPFELNHENYALEASGSYRVGSIDIAGAFHHVSRHLSDRPNLNIIAWNVVEARATRRFVAGTSTFEATLEAGHVLQRTYVDYAWTSNLRIATRRPISRRVAVIATGVGRLVGVDRSKLDRDRQCGGRVEGGIRLNGAAGALEFVAGYERRIDGFPTDRVRVRAFTVGFRLSSR